MIEEKENLLFQKPISVWVPFNGLGKKCFPSTTRCDFFSCAMLSLFYAMIWFIRLVDLPILSCLCEAFAMSSEIKNNLLRANVCNFRESVDSHEFLSFFIFCPNNLYNTLISKITLKLVTAFFFFRNQAKFEKL